jgi:hypothetical protein
MRKLGQPEGESPLLTFRVKAETMAALKMTADKKGLTVSEVARQCLENCGELMYRSEAARRLIRKTKKDEVR